MKPMPIVPALLARDEFGVPYSSAYQDVYHPRAGALLQARHVFIGGTDLQARWRGQERFVILETGFGLGSNFLATWAAWRDDPQRCTRLVFISIENSPYTQGDLRKLHAESPLRDLADSLIDAWPPLTRNLHNLTFEGGRVQLQLALGDVQEALPELRASVDAIYLDGFAPARNPRMWDRRVCKALGRLAAPGATLATWSAASALRADLTTAGFDVRLAAGVGGKRDITLARYAPRHTPATRVSPTTTDRSALIIGGGLAGCAVAWALAEHGWHSRILERGEQIAGAASGNPAGLFHGIVNADDGVHARFNRAASFEARHAVAIAVGEHGALGGLDGLLRLEHEIELARLHSMLRALGLPPNYVDALSAEAASELCGMPLRSPAWFYPGGGWVQPAALARSFVERAAGAVEVQHAADVQTLRRSSGNVPGWQALDRAGRVIAEAPMLIIANAAAANSLIPAAALPMQSVRGQLSWVEAQHEPGLLTRLPIAGAGYLLPSVEGRIIFGATSQVGDNDASVRIGDHVDNLAQLARLSGGRGANIDPASLGGRTAWRCVAPDRLPLVGAVAALEPLVHADAARLDQVRFTARESGLFVCTALGSRGITWSTLGARVLAATIVGAPPPLEASLLDAIDPARFAVRAARQSAAAGGA